MKRILAGGTGLIGTHLVTQWQAAGHEIIVISRDPARVQARFGNRLTRLQALPWQALQASVLQDAQVLVNLAGANIGTRRWTAKRRSEILDSRTCTTAQLARLCAQLGAAAPPLFNASAVGVYGLQTEQPDGLPPPYDEDTPIDFQQKPDFLAEVARAWEQATWPAVDAGVRVVCLRFGVVLAKQGGALSRLRWPFHVGLGGPMGSGRQPFSWISLEDAGRAVEFLIQQPTVQGPVNLVAPEAVTQRQFARTLGQVLYRPSMIPTPACLLKWVFGEMADQLLLKGQHAVPKRLQAMGFPFQYPTLKAALAAALRG